jgi:hypothetical protein
MNGPDNPSNFALTHSSCNRSKQASDLNVARILARFETLKTTLSSENRGPNLNDILKLYNGSIYPVNFIRNGMTISYSFPEKGNNQIISQPFTKMK